MGNEDPAQNSVSGTCCKQQADYEAEHLAWLNASQPGAIVYRANCYDGSGDDIRQGVVVRIETGRISSSGAFIRMDGAYHNAHHSIVAQFPRTGPSGTQHGYDHYQQTCDGHEFNVTKLGAVKRLIEYLESAAWDKIRNAEKLLNRAQKLKDSI